MNLPLVDRIGDWNPQLLREIKGKVQLRNVLITVFLSLASQVLFVLSYLSRLPTKADTYPSYCFTTTIKDQYSTKDVCQLNSLGEIMINWPKWWSDVFIWFSVSAIFILLLGGIFLLITDLDKEEKRGTLNFLRLSPQLPEKLIIGKLLGVPILIYLAALTALPLQFYSGLSAHISSQEIFLLDLVIVGNCLAFYLAGMLFNFVANWLGGFQSWLAMGSTFILLIASTSKYINNTSTDIIDVLAPFLTLKSLIYAHLDDFNNYYGQESHQEKLQLFYQPIGYSVITIAAISLLCYALISYWSLQALKRRLPAPGSTLLSKGQSYLFTASLEIFILGLALQNNEMSYEDNFIGFFAINLLLFLTLIVILTPNYQTLQDWARYRHTLVKKTHGLGLFSRGKDLIFGEKSPGLVALLINVVEVNILLTLWVIIISKKDGVVPVIPIMFIPPIIFMVYTLSFILLYALVAQMFIFSKLPKSGMWAFVTVGAAISLPPIMWSFLLLDTEKIPVLWLSSTYPLFWGWNISNVLAHAGINGILFPLLGQWSAIVLLNLQLNRRLKLAGQSATKALLSGHR